MAKLITSIEFKTISTKLRESNQIFKVRYPGESSARQPVHTVYGGANLFSASLAKKMSETAVKTFNEYGATPEKLAMALTGSYENAKLWNAVHKRVQDKLAGEAVEDFRIDFEDGYGNRSDEEEDGHAKSAAEEVALGLKNDTLPPFIGIRIKPFSDECFQRSMRTLDIFVTTLVEKTGGKIPPQFVITLPKITITEQSAALTQALTAIENNTGLENGTLKFEIMVETTQSIMDDQGICPLRAFVDAGEGRCIGAHFGTYDYTAGCNITAEFQTMAHSVCDFAKHMMKVALTGTGVMLSDGATNVMPIGPHRAGADGKLSLQQRQENEAIVHRAWRLAYSHIRHSLVNGFYQGWDLHPAQLPVRYAAVYAFFQESLESTTHRLKVFVEKAARATLLGDVFDDAATGQGLLNFFLRGLSCGAISVDEAKATGLSLEEIQSRSFLKILDGRKSR